MRDTPMRLPFNCSGRLISGLAINAVGQQTLDPADKRRVLIALYPGAGNARRADHRHFAIAGKYRRHRRRAGRDKHHRHIQVVFLKQSGLLGDPRIGLRHHPGGVDEVHLIRGKRDSGGGMKPRATTSRIPDTHSEQSRNLPHGADVYPSSHNPTPHTSRLLSVLTTAYAGCQLPTPSESL